MDFDTAFNLVVGAEGIFTDDPRDAGNWTDGKAKGTNGGKLLGTKYGISARVYGKELMGKGISIKDLTLDEAKAIYSRDYWDRCRCDELPDYIRYPVFSCAVNCGVKTASEILQDTVCGIKDGKIGSATIKAVRNFRDTERLYEEFLQRWAEYYEEIAAKDPSQQVFLKGWLNRIKEVKKNNNA